jgi:hypothetical protein
MSMSKNRDFLIELTGSLYCLTLLFPKKEPLRYKMREKAIEILAQPNEKDLDVLDRFFEIALIQKWVSFPEILSVKTKYDNLRRELLLGQSEEIQKETLFSSRENREELKQNNDQQESNPVENNLVENSSVENSSVENNSVENNQPFNGLKIVNGINQRQEKILEFLKENGRAQVWQIKEVMPDITKRTLRRDFEQMLKQGMIKRIGERNNTFYQIKVNQA